MKHCKLYFISLKLTWIHYKFGHELKLTKYTFGQAKYVSVVVLRLNYDLNHLQSVFLDEVPHIKVMQCGSLMLYLLPCVI